MAALVIGSILVYLHSPGVRLGLPFGGGIQLVLAADVDAAVVLEVEEDVAYLNEIFRQEGEGRVARQPFAMALDLVMEAPASEAVALLDDRIGSYVHTASVGKVHRFVLSPPRREAIADRIGARLVEMVDRRAAERVPSCPLRIERFGDHLVLVEWVATPQHSNWGDCQ
ncbi:MAG: hypothetical protein KTR31_02045 [Myxococcales bacterium]|nr:hypothetical protein [Myxococcales bacterium]